MAFDSKTRETRQRLEKCWEHDLDWTLIPEYLRKGCFQLGKALCIPPTAVLAGLLSITSYVISPAVIEVSGTEWNEPTLLWISINMPTGSTKSALYHYLQNIVLQVRTACGYTSRDPVWLLGDATCEKMGDLMAANGGRLMGLYDELCAFLTQLNLYRGKGLTLTHELALFLQLYNGHSWTRTTVTGEANFSMSTTSLTVGGFSQPAIARNLIEQSSSAEIGLTQRFLWVFPKPSFARFDTLEAVDSQFTTVLVQHLAKVWKVEKTKFPEATVYNISSSCETFRAKFDAIQEQLEILASMDDLLSGMLSKSKGLILRVAAGFHVLFTMGTDGNISLEVSVEAINAAIAFVELCCQQTAFMAGRGPISEDIEIIRASGSTQTASLQDQTKERAAYTLKLPGKKLNLTALTYTKKFRNYGWKEGAMEAFEELEKAGLGSILKESANAGKERYTFVKVDIPKESSEKSQLAKKLSTYNVSLQTYSRALRQDEILTPKEKENRKRSLFSYCDSEHDTSTDGPSTPIRRSPRKQNCVSPHTSPSE